MEKLEPPQQFLFNIKCNMLHTWNIYCSWCSYVNSYFWICEYINIATTEDRGNPGKSQTGEGGSTAHTFLKKPLEFLGLSLFPWRLWTVSSLEILQKRPKTNENSAFIITPVNPTSVLNDPVIFTCCFFNTPWNSMCSVSRWVYTYMCWLPCMKCCKFQRTPQNFEVKDWIFICV